MPTLKEISDKLDETQIALDAEQQQVADLLAQKDAALVTANELIASLQLLVADGGTAEERQAVLDKANALKTDLEATVAP